MANDETFGNGVRDHTSQQSDGTNCIVIARNRVSDVIRVRVGVEDSDDGDAELGGFAHREVFALGVDNPQRAGGLGEVTNSTERLVELDELAAFHEEFLLGESLGRVIEVDLFQFLHALEAAEDGLEVGEKSTEPTLVDVGLSDAAGFRRDRFLGLLLGSDEQDCAATCNGLTNEFVGVVNVCERLLKVDDVDARPLGQDEALDFRIPTLSLVSKVNTAVEQLANCYNGHCRSPYLWFYAVTDVSCPGVRIDATHLGTNGFDR